MPAGGIIGLPQAAEAGNTYADVFINTKALISPANVATIVCAEQAITITGLKATDQFISANKPTLVAGAGVIQGRVSAANTARLTFTNPTAGSGVPGAAELYRLSFFRPQS